jgi:hypothetical protein
MESHLNKRIKLIPHEKTLKHPWHHGVEIFLTYTISNHIITSSFEVINPNNDWNPAKSFFSDDTHSFRKNWGLWDHDVVEFFIENNETKEYLEFQLSIDKKPFALIIKKPRELYYSPLELNFKTDVNTSQDSTIFDIQLNLPWNSGTYRGNFFCCLGPKDQRGHYALNINTDGTPDFHRPDLFKKI